MSNQIQNKLSQYEVQPPARVWNEISAALDSGVAHSFAEKLYSFEQVPAEEAWQKINEQLHDHSHAPARVVPFFKKYRRPLKYSSALAAFVVLAFLMSLLINKKSVSEGTVNLVGTPVEQKRNDPQQPVEMGELPKQISIARLNTTKRIGHLHLSSAKNSLRLGPEPILKATASAGRVVPEYAERTSAINYAATEDKYMIYSDGDGNAVRLPKKLFEAFACPTDKITCKQKIKKLQEQVAASAMRSDFTGILDMLNKLEENQ